MLKKTIYGALGVSASGLILATMLVSMPKAYVGSHVSEIDTELTEDDNFDFWEDEEAVEDSDGEEDLPDLFNTYHLTEATIDSLVHSNVFNIGRIDPMRYNSTSNKEDESKKGPKFTWEDAEAETEIAENETIGYDTNAEPGEGGDVLKSVATNDLAERFKRYGVLPVSEEVYGVSSEFGPRVNPIGDSKEKVFHTGLDIWSDNISGKEVYSMLPGVVSHVGNNPAGYGQHIIVDHDGFKTLYAHFTTTPNYKVGDNVAAGDTLGLVGSTGRSTGPHLHIEIDVEGVKINPKPFMSIVGSVGNKNEPKEIYVQAETKSSEEESEMDDQDDEEENN